MCLLSGKSDSDSNKNIAQAQALKLVTTFEVQYTLERCFSRSRCMKQPEKSNFLLMVWELRGFVDNTRLNKSQGYPLHFVYFLWTKLLVFWFLLWGESCELFL